MGAVRTQNKKQAQCAHLLPSFVYRQDGYELSYKVRVIIAAKRRFVKKGKSPLRKVADFLAKGFKKKRGRKEVLLQKERLTASASFLLL